MTKQNIITTVIDHLDSHSYEELYFYLLKNSETFSLCRKLEKIDDRIIENPPERFFQSAEAFFLNYYPYAIYKNFSIDKLNLSELKRLVIQYLKNRTYDLWLPVDGTAIYAISNYDSSKLGLTDEELLEHYKKELASILTDDFTVGVGNINTLMNSQENSFEQYSKLVEKFFVQNYSGVCITLSDDRILATRFVAEREFDGIITPSSTVFQPIIKKVLDADDKLVEFNDLINNNVKESILEEFLYANYSLIFGEKYDTISTQVWLEFPEFDIGNKKRRMDILMRNATLQDWEVFELKRTSVNLTKTKSDVPLFVSAVNDAIMQLKNYKYILSKDAVRRDFEAKGIEYYDPKINLVIGKRPNIPKYKWDWLLSQHQDLKILTYGDLYDDAKTRLDSWKELLRKETVF